MKIFDKLISGAKSAVKGFINKFAAEGLSKLTNFLSPLAQKALESPIGKIAQRFIPGLAQKVEDFLNPARLTGMFGGANNPGDFASLLGSAFRNVPILGDLLGG